MLQGSATAPDTAARATGHVHGYARVSTGDQTSAPQEDALRRAGVERVWTDTASGATTSRPQLDGLRAPLLPGDTLVVWRLDTLGRSTAHLIATIDELAARGVTFRSLTEQIDTGSATGRLILSVRASLAAFERDLIRERTRAGLGAARSSRVARPSRMRRTRLECRVRGSTGICHAD